MTKTRPGTPYPARPRQSVAVDGGRVWMLISLSLMGALTATLAFPTFIILVCGLPPAIVRGLIDRRGGRNMFACVLITNLCGVAPVIVRLWSNGNTLQTAMMLLTDPYVWLVMYGAAAAGWGLLWIVPEFVEIALTLIDNERIRKLRHYQRKLIVEWGSGVAGACEPTAPKAGKARMTGKARRARA